MLHKSKKDILNGNIAEQILLFTIPMCGSYLLQQLYQIADSVVLGRYASVEALAAVGGSTTMVVNIMLNIITGIATGAMVVVAQNYGRGDVEKLRDSVKTGMFIAVTFGGALSILGAICAKPLLTIMKCPEETIHLSLIYMYSYLVGIIPYTVYMMGNYILRATGDTKISLLFTIIIAITKIILDLILTAILKLGVWGVSISTVVSYIVCGVVVLVILNNTTNAYQYSIKDFGYNSEILKNIYKIGVPVAIQSAVFAITNAYVSVRINEHGTKSIAAYTAYNNVDNFYWSFTNSIGAAIVTIAGQNYGNKNMKRVKETLKYGMLIHLGITVVVSAFCILAGKQTLHIFTTDQNVIDLAYEMLMVVAATYFTYIPVEMVSATIKGCGDSMNSMIIAIIGICVVRTLYLTVFTFASAVEVTYCYPISWTITSLIYLGYYFINKKYRLS